MVGELKKNCELVDLKCQDKFRGFHASTAIELSFQQETGNFLASYMDVIVCMKEL
jgi:hypothetical protein